MKELLKKLEQELKELKLRHERVRGSVPRGPASGWWDGRVQGVEDAIKLLKEFQA